MGAHPLAPGRDRGGELGVVELGHRGHVRGRVDQHLVRAARRPRREEVGFAGPARGQQRVAAAGEGAGLGPGRPARRPAAAPRHLATVAERRIEVRDHPRPPARRVGRAAARPQRVELGRRAVLVALAERAVLGALRLAAARAEKLSGRSARPGARIVLSPLSWSMRISGALRTARGGGRRARGGGSGGAGGRGGFGLAAAGVVVGAADERLEHVHRQREDDGGVLVAADFQQRLQVAQLQRGGVGADDVGRVGELLRRLELALGVDDLGPPLALGLGLAGDRALHLLGDFDVLDLDRGHLHAPGLGRLVDDLLQLFVESLALGEQLVELGLAEHRAQRRLRDLRGGDEEVFDLDDRFLGVDDAEVGDRVDAGRDVVAGDHLLRRDVEGDRPQVDA